MGFLDPIAPSVFNDFPSPCALLQSPQWTTYHCLSKKFASFPLSQPHSTHPTDTPTPQAMNSTLPTPSPSNPEVSEEEIPLCTSCLAPNDARANFCSKCGAPLTAYAAIGPFESLFAQGYAVRQAAERPRRPIVLLGIWLVFGPAALVGALMLMTPHYSNGGEWIIAGMMMVLSLAIIAKTTWSFLRCRTPLTSKPPD